MRLGIIALVVLLAAGGVFVLTRITGSRGEPDSMEAATDAAANSAGARPIPVGVAILRRGEVEDAVTAWGTVSPYQQAVMLSELSGQVSAVHVSLGDAVRSGQVLLEIDPTLYVALAEEAEAKIESARVAKERTANDLGRMEVLFERGTASRSELEVARANAAEADAGYASALAALERAKKNLSGARLRAPFDGHIASRPPDPGSTVTIGTPLLTLVDIGHLRVDVLVSEQDISRIQPGRKATLTVAGAPGGMFAGTVQAIGPQTDPETRQFPVEIEVENPPGHPLKGGMVAKVVMVYESFEGVPLLPVDALVETDAGPAFFAVENGVAYLRDIEIGPRRGQVIGILSGAAAGDTAVVLGTGRLTDGAAVQVDEVR